MKQATSSRMHERLLAKLHQGQHDAAREAEILRARQIQRERGCLWGDAMKAATEPYRDPPGFEPGRVQADKHRGNTVPRTADGKFPIYRP